MHLAVMVNEVVDLLAVKKCGVYVDGTLGGGGHAWAILEAAGDEGFLIGIDRDRETLERARKKLEPLKGRTFLTSGNFAELERIVKNAGYARVNGIVLDLGISSWQLDDAERGFSFLKEGPLDMRMDRQEMKTAEDIVNTLSAEDLGRILRDYGEEPLARRIAAGIVNARRSRPIRTTQHLAGIVEKAAGGKRSRIHPATRTFQALRLAVNDELGNLEKGLEAGLQVLVEGGRFAVISFHSLEDRIVKRSFMRHAGKWESLAAGGRRLVVERPLVSVVTRKPVMPSDREIAENPRARSAKLRVVERLE